MRRIPLVLAAALVAAVAFAKVAEPDPAAPLLKPTPEDADAALLASRFLTRFHYKPVPLDDAMSRMIFDRYLDALDGDRLFFTRADIERFSSARDEIDDAIYERELGVPFAIFNLYEQRVAERIAYARSLLPKGFDFTRDEQYAFDREDADWPASAAELDEIWRKRVKNDWLRLKLAKESDASAAAKDADGAGDAAAGETAAAAPEDNGAKPAKSSQDIAAEIRETLDKRYANYLDRVQELDREDVFQTFMNAYAMSIEPHTNYLGPRASENFDISMRLSLEGIGAVLQRDEEYTAIREIVPGGPAALSGKLDVGDRIVGVGQGADGPMVDVIGWRLDDVVEKIRGPKDTVVRLEILPAEVGPDGKHELLVLTRKKVSIEEQAAKKSVIEVPGDDGTHRIGVISLPTFYQDFEARRRGDDDFRSATRDVERLLGELREESVDGVVIDLRNNGGGSLAEATDLTGLFIDRGPVVQVRSAGGRVEEENDPKPGMAWDGPLAVLVNRASASASEIFAAAIQDYGRGVVIGEPTFGKGTVQNLVDLDEVAHNEKPTYGELKMTIAQFFRVDGGSTQLRGVTPDISFPMTVAADEFGESSYDNALPWTSIAAADYRPAGDLAPILPMLAERHAARVADNAEWQRLAADLAQARERRAQKSVSLNEAVRRAERAAQEGRRDAREPGTRHAVPDADPATQMQRRVLESVDTPAAPEPDAGEDDADFSTPIDDGLQPNERDVRAERAREKAREERRDVVLEEAAHILADEIDLLRADTQLAARVLPGATRLPAPAADGGLAD